jgi:2-dehydro-3-deoxygluconokinase
MLSWQKRKSMPRFDVTTIGEGQLRLSVPVGSRLETTDQFNVHVAGTEANVTGLLARLGWQCGWVSSLPDTPLGRRVYNEYRQAGLDLGAVKWGSHRLATYYVEYAVPPRATQVYFDRANTGFTLLTPNDINWDYLLDTRVLHLSGLTMPLSANVQGVLLEALQRAKAAGVKISFDVNYRSRLWTPSEAAAVLKPVLQSIDVLFCGRSDAKSVFGIAGEPEHIVAQLGEICPASHIVTSLSHEGLIGWDRQDYTHETAQKVTVIDRIGAGDAMVAGVLHGWLAGDFVKGLRYGAFTAALALSQYGDQVITNSQELEALLVAPRVDIVR